MDYENKWWRVIDPLNPLYGCDVSGRRVAWDDETDETLMISVRRMRRVDVFVGDRPFQLVAKEGESLGLWIDVTHLEESPMQGDVEIGHDKPYGTCLDESDLTRGDGCMLRIVRYEKAQQVALDSPSGQLLANKTFGTADGSDSPGLRSLINKFSDEADVEDLVYDLKRRD